MNKQQAFIAKIAPHAQRIQEEYGVPASVAIAQAALETGWGSKAEGNNYFGVKAGAHWSGPTQTFGTHEYVNGKRVNMSDEFRAYDCVSQSIEDYAQVLSTSNRYAGAMQVAYDPEKFAWAVERAGYATDPQYAEKLVSIIKSYDLARYDHASYQGYTDRDAEVKRYAMALEQKRSENPEPWSNFFAQFMQAITELLEFLSPDIQLADNQKLETPRTPQNPGDSGRYIS